MSANGWLLQEVYITRECGATPWQSFFVSQAARLANFSSDYDLAQDIQRIQASLDRLQATCSSEGGMPIDQEQRWQHDFSDLPAGFLSRLNNTVRQYNACLQSSHAPVYRQNLHSHAGQSYDRLDLAAYDVLDPATASRQLSFECLIAAVSDVTTTGFTMHIRIQRFAGYFVVKLLLPVVRIPPTPSPCSLLLCACPGSA